MADLYPGNEAHDPVTLIYAKIFTWEERMAKSPEDAVILSCFCKNSLGILFKLKISKNKS